MAGNINPGLLNNNILCSLGTISLNNFQLRPNQWLNYRCPLFLQHPGLTGCLECENCCQVEHNNCCSAWHVQYEPTNQNTFTKVSWVLPEPSPNIKPPIAFRMDVSWELEVELEQEITIWRNYFSQQNLNNGVQFIELTNHDPARMSVIIQDLTLNEIIIPGGEDKIDKIWFYLVCDTNLLRQWGITCFNGILANQVSTTITNNLQLVNANPLTSISTVRGQTTTSTNTGTVPAGTCCPPSDLRIIFPTAVNNITDIQVYVALNNDPNASPPLVTRLILTTPTNQTPSQLVSTYQANPLMPAANPTLSPGPDQNQPVIWTWDSVLTTFIIPVNLYADRTYELTYVCANQTVSDPIVIDLVSALSQINPDTGEWLVFNNRPCQTGGSIIQTP